MVVSGGSQQTCEAQKWSFVLILDTVSKDFLILFHKWEFGESSALVFFLRTYNEAREAIGGKEGKGGRNVGKEEKKRRKRQQISSRKKYGKTTSPPTWGERKYGLLLL